MAAIVSAATGLWSATATWVGGVVPSIADTVTIAATHVVTVDGTYVTGGDVTTGFILSGTLKASRTVNSSLTVRANINPNTAGGGFDYGTLADPIPQGVTATLIYNDSATFVVNKYQILPAANNANLRFCGAPKTRNAFLTAPVSAGATSIQVTSASGWVVSDQLYLEQPTTTMSQIETVTITTAPVASGDNWLVGVSAITHARVAGLAVSNITCNVTIRTSSPLHGSTANFRASTTTGVCEFRNMLFNHMGSMFFPMSNPVVNLPIIDSCVSQNNSTTNTAFNPQNQSSFGNVAFSNNVFISNNTGSTIIPNLCQINFNNNVCYSLSTAGSNVFITSAYGNLATENRFNGFNAPLGFSAASLSVYTNTRIRSQNTFPIGNTFGDFNVVFNNADILTPSTIAYTNILTGALGTITFQNPTVDSVTKFNGNWAFNTAKVLAYSIGGVFNANRQSTYTTLAVNQNAIVNRATNNISLQLNNLQPSGSYSFDFQGVAGVSQRIVGYLRHDATYGTSIPPSIAFSGAGVSGSFVSSSTVDLWEKFDITLTPTSTATITATVTFAGASGGTAYLDGVYQFPWITESWVYGFQKLAQVNSVVDANVTLSETAVAALASISTFDEAYDAATYSAIVSGPTSGAYSPIATAAGTVLDFGGNTVAINNAAGAAFAFAGGVATLKAAALTVGSKFKTLKAQTITLANAVGTGALVGNVAQATPTALTNVSITGDLTYNTNTPITVTLTDCTVTGTISNTGTAVVTVILAGTTTIGTVGANVLAKRLAPVTAPNLQAGSTVILVNADTGAIIDQQILSSAGYVYNFNWTTNITVTLRHAKIGYIPKISTGVLTVAGISFLDVQAVDAVYNANNIDGSTVTEFTADYPHIQIDLSDSDGTTTFQRMYNWFRYIETSYDGLLYFVDGLTATDESNYVIDVSVIDLKIQNLLTAPVIITGGNMTRSDGTTIIAADSGSIQIQPGKAYVANSANIYNDLAVLKTGVNISKVNGLTITGSGTEDYPWGPVV